MTDDEMRWEAEGGYSPPVSDTRQDMTEVQDQRDRSPLLDVVQHFNQWGRV